MTKKWYLATCTPGMTNAMRLQLTAVVTQLPGIIKLVLGPAKPGSGAGQ